MTIKDKKQLLKFHNYVEERLSQGGEDLLPEEILRDWRQQFPLEDDGDDPLDETLDDQTAVRRALDDMKAGDSGIPLDEFLENIDSEYKLGLKNK